MPRRGLTASLAAVSAMIGLISVPSSAGEIPIYESLSDVTIGRVFLTPGQRAYLDTRPVMRPVMSPRPVQEAPAPEPVKRKKNPAGYIINGHGESSVWSQRGFVTREDASGISFPGDVKVIREESVEPSDLSSTESRNPSPNGNPDAADNGT